MQNLPILSLTNYNNKYLEDSINDCSTFLLESDKLFGKIERERLLLDNKLYDMFKHSEGIKSLFTMLKKEYSETCFINSLYESYLWLRNKEEDTTKGLQIDLKAVIENSGTSQKELKANYLVSRLYHSLF